MSVTFPTNSGSVENLNDAAFQGLIPYAPDECASLKWPHLEA